MLVDMHRTEWIVGKSLKKLKFFAVEVKVDIDIQRALGVHVVFALKQHRRPVLSVPGNERALRLSFMSRLGIAAEGNACADDIAQYE